MSDPVDFIMPMLREMRAENVALHEKTRTDLAKDITRLDGIIELLEAKVRELEAAK